MPETIEFDRYSLMIDEERTFVRSGAMHYFRLPSVDLWRDRLLKLKAAGYNTVDLYFNWGYHSPAQGQYDFTGIRDVKKLITMTDELGFYLIARPGPYINAETNGGGFPNWLLAKKELPLRNRRNSAFEWSDEYMRYVTEWWEQIVPQFADAPNLILTQIENEYSTSGVEPEYMQALYDLTRKLGVTVPLFHNDLFAAGLYSDIVDIYAFDNYSVTQFDTSWRDMPGVFSMLDYLEQNLSGFCAAKNRPMMAAELQAGWFGLWQGHTYQNIQESLGREHIQISTKTVIAQGVTVFNHYKAIGGTNWDHVGSAETYTSYDFNAPISESGILKKSYSEARLLNLMLANFDFMATESIDPTESWKEEPTFYKLRKIVSDNQEDSQWLFIRNLENDPKAYNFKWETGNTIGELNPHEMLILPVNIRLKSGLTVCSANTELVIQTEHYLIIRGDRPASLEIMNDTGETEAVIFDQQEPCGFTVKEIAGYKIIALGRDYLDKLWVQEDDSLYCGADTMNANGELCIAQNTKVLQIPTDGNIIQQELAVETNEYEVPDLTSWQVTDVAEELHSLEGFVPVSSAGADLDSNQIYDGTVWYEYTFTPMGNELPKTLTLDAQHIWGVFLNGQYVGAGHQLNLIYGQKAEPAFLPLPQPLLKPNEENRLVVLLHSLGHPKGFHDDAQDSQGIHQFLIDGMDVIQKLLIKKETLGRGSTLNSSTPVVQLTTTFTLDIPEGKTIPIGLDIASLNVEHVQIYLNGTLLGRYWKECQAQQVFYLPEGVLNTRGENTLSLVLMNFDPLINPRECNTNACPTGASRVMLKAYAQYQQIT